MLTLITDENRDLYEAELATALSIHRMIFSQNANHRRPAYFCRTDLTESDMEESDIILHQDDAGHPIAAALFIADPAHPLHYDFQKKYWQSETTPRIQLDAPLFTTLFAFGPGEERPAPEIVIEEMLLMAMVLAFEQKADHIWMVCRLASAWELMDHGVKLIPLGKPSPAPANPNSRMATALPVNAETAYILAALTGMNELIETGQDKSDFEHIRQQNEVIEQLHAHLMNPENRELTEYFCRIKDKSVRDHILSLTDEIAQQYEDRIKKKAIV